MERIIAVRFMLHSVSVYGEVRQDPAIQALAAALCSDEVKTYIEENYNGAVVAVF